MQLDEGVVIVLKPSWQAEHVLGEEYVLHPKIKASDP